MEEKYKLNPEAASDILESVKYYEERNQKVAVIVLLAVWHKKREERWKVRLKS